jgi:hypothetical protein
MGLMAARMGNRMQTRQMMRTASRMERRRSAMGMNTWGQQPQQPEPEPQYAPPPQAPPPPPQPDMATQLQQLAQLQQQGLITEEEYAAKKAQVLGI